VPFNGREQSGRKSGFYQFVLPLPFIHTYDVRVLPLVVYRGAHTHLQVVGISYNCFKLHIHSQSWPPGRDMSHSTSTSFLYSFDTIWSSPRRVQHGQLCLHGDGQCMCSVVLGNNVLRPTTLSSGRRVK
jgi:hypothetical protein